MRISDWSSDVCSSGLGSHHGGDTGRGDATTTRHHAHGLGRTPAHDRQAARPATPPPRPTGRRTARPHGEGRVSGIPNPTSSAYRASCTPYVGQIPGRQGPKEGGARHSGTTTAAGIQVQFATTSKSPELKSKQIKAICSDFEQ